MQYTWHFPENSWGQISFAIILVYDKVLSQVLPDDKPFCTMNPKIVET